MYVEFRARQNCVSSQLQTFSRAAGANFVDIQMLLWPHICFFGWLDGDN
jgi:hypothetical protein